MNHFLGDLRQWSDYAWSHMLPSQTIKCQVSGELNLLSYKHL